MRTFRDLKTTKGIRYHAEGCSSPSVCSFNVIHLNSKIHTPLSVTPGHTNWIVILLPVLVHSSSVMVPNFTLHNFLQFTSTSCNSDSAFVSKVVILTRA